MPYIGFKVRDHFFVYDNPNTILNKLEVIAKIHNNFYGLNKSIDVIIISQRSNLSKLLNGIFGFHKVAICVVEIAPTLKSFAAIPPYFLHLAVERRQNSFVCS